MGRFLVFLVALLLLLCGCGRPEPSGTVVPPALITPSSPTTPTDPTSTTAPAATPPTAPELVSWGTTDTLLSLVVRNRDHREIRSARVLIKAYDGQHRLLVATTGPRTSKCCTVLGLPPGGEFGLFLDLPHLAGRVRHVEVGYDTVHTAPWPRHRPPTITTADATLTRRPGDAVVVATFTAHGPVRPYVVGQAFLAGGRGHLVATISGRFYCFRDGTTRRLRMHLQHPVPPHTHIRAVVGYPVPPGEPTLIRDSCH